MGANLSRVFFIRFTQNRHPERSASPIGRVTQRLWRGVEGPRRCFIYPMLLRAFRPPKPDKVFPGAENAASKGWRRAKKLKLIRSIHPEFKELAQTWAWKMITKHEKI